MGYDFCIMPLKDAGKWQFPISFDLIPDEDQVGYLPWPEFRQWIKSIGGTENGSNDSLVVDYGGDEYIYFSGNEEYISLDVHSDWSRVLEAFQKLLDLEPNCSLTDPQSGDFHDIQSFKAFWGADA